MERISSAEADMTKSAVDELTELIAEVATLSENATSREVTILAKAIACLAKQSFNNRQNNRSAFEQIQELGRRQEPDDLQADPRTPRPR